MKKLSLMVFMAAAIFVSCKKESSEKTKNLCPVIAEAAVPKPVKDSFAVRYPATVVKTWFYKDSSSYCAAFKVLAVEKLALFAPNGTFIKEEIESDHEDSTKNNIGCECEVD